MVDGSNIKSYNEKKGGCMQKSVFGDWLKIQLEKYNISVIELSDYSGVHVRRLYRILSGSKLSLEDAVWLIDCISDMTDQKELDLMLDLGQRLIGYKI